MVLSVGKTKMINVRLTEKTHEDFRIASELRGASMSSLLHQYVVRTIREEKDRDPKAFSAKPQPPKKQLGGGKAFYKSKKPKEIITVDDFWQAMEAAGLKKKDNKINEEHLAKASPKDLQHLFEELVANALEHKK